MKIAIIVILFLVGTVGSAMQALKYVERRREQQDKDKRDDRSSSDRPPP